MPGEMELIMFPNRRAAMSHLAPAPRTQRRSLAQAIGLGAAAVGAALGAIGLNASGVRPMTNAGSARDSIWAPSSHPLFDGREWLNTDPLGAGDLRDKVVLVNFWTYSCINSLRTLPYLRAWAATYGERGLVVLGVHSPEFAFEHEIGNVRTANATLAVDYPVVLDNDFAVWRSFGNRAWPGFFFVGANGRVEHRKFGEGEYDQSERLIQRLLGEGTGASVRDEIRDVPGEGPEAAPDWLSLSSPETYVGHGRASGFASPGGIRRDSSARYEAPTSLLLNRWGLGGVWTVGREFATLDEPGGAIRFRFSARDLHLVLGREENAGPVRYRVTMDGAAPGLHRGVDVDRDGWGSIEEPRMYQLIRQQQPVADRTFTIEFSEPGARAYAFTFG